MCFYFYLFKNNSSVVPVFILNLTIGELLNCGCVIVFNSSQECLWRAILEAAQLEMGLRCIFRDGKLATESVDVLPEL